MMLVGSPFRVRPFVLPGCSASLGAGDRGVVGTGRVTIGEVRNRDTFMLWLGSGPGLDLVPGVVAETAQNVVDTSGVFAGDREGGT